MSQYSPTGTPLSPSTGWTNGHLNHPQGTAVDQKGSVHHQRQRPQPPFAVQIDGYGRAWVTNAGPGGAKLVGTRAAILVGTFGGSITVIGPDFKPASFSPIQSKSFRWPLGLAIDAKNNAWTRTTSEHGHPDPARRHHRRDIQTAARDTAMVGGHRWVRPRLGGRLRHPPRVAPLRH